MKHGTGRKDADQGARCAPFGLSGGLLGESIRQAEKSPADLILLDNGAGGTGTVFDWSLLRHIKRPYFLAGGLGPHNLTEAIKTVHPWGVDMSSGVETDVAKDKEKILAAVAAVRRTEA